jgi:cytochrome c-type biogenesis protein CcmE
MDDLTPRPAPEPRRRSNRRWVPMLVLGLVVVAGGVIVTQFLTSAVDYYCNVDEIGSKSGCDADRRLRVQGTVEEGSVATAAGVTTFVIAFGGEELAVRYEGEPGGIFKECVPVVVHGRIVDGTFEGDRVEVKHSEEYVADNGDRLDGPEATTCEAVA